MRSLVKDRKVLAVFSDPAGAKAVLSFLKLNSDCPCSVVVVSDRDYDFYSDFGYQVIKANSREISDWLNNVDILVSGTSFPAKLEYEFVEEALKRNIYVVSYVDHWINIADRYKYKNRCAFPNIVGVVDKRAYDIARKQNIPKAVLKVTGNPYHEYLRNWRPRVSRDEMLQALGMDSTAQYILYAPEPISKFGLKEKYGFDEIDGLNLLLNAKYAMPINTINIIIKGHPNQDHSIFINKVKELRDGQVIYVTDTDFNTLAFYANLVVGFFSNALIEADIICRPVIQLLTLLRHGNINSLDGFLKNVEIALSADDLNKAIRKNLVLTET